MVKLTFNETTYLFQLLKTKSTYDSDIVIKQGSVIINGVGEYYLEYSYSPNSELFDEQALYEIYNVDNDSDNPSFKKYGEQGFPFYMVQSMVSYIIKQKKQNLTIS